MDEIQVVKETLNSTLQRHARAVQNHEIEIANFTAEIIRLQAQIDALTKDIVKEDPTNNS